MEVNAHSAPLLHKRTPRIDNLRAILISLVVFGHCLELTDSFILYRTIYAFHMPAFLFLSGFCMKGGARKTASTALVYAVFQVLYRCFDAVILKGGAAISLSFATPYWILWYTMTTLWYTLLFPLLPKAHPTAMLGLIISASIGALACGYANGIGYFLSLSRMLCFLPFYLCGVLCAHHAPLRDCITGEAPRRRAVIAVSGGLCALSALFLALRPDIERRMFYGSYAYAAEGYGPDVRLSLLLIAAVWIVLLVSAVPNRHIPYLTALGRHTYPVYLCHGFILRLLKNIAFFRFTPAVNLALSLAVTLAILALFGNPALSRKSIKAQP